jgi:hypothetical protein
MSIARTLASADQITVEEEDRIIIHNVFNELVLFAKATSIVAASLRYEYVRSHARKDEAGNTRIIEWYRRMYDLDPRCANIDCGKALPQPEDIGNITAIRQSFSVGVRDARVGMYSVRRMISTNRKFIYPCFYVMILCKE